MNLNSFKKEINPLIETYLNGKIKSIPHEKDLLFLKAQFQYIKEFIKDGKRIRPYVSYITYLSFGGNKNKELINFLVFLEIFHYFCLIHDDIMDNSSQRHGIKTLNKNYGNSEAILLGDYLFSWAWEIILSSNLESKKKEKLFILFQEMIDDVFLGQALDVYSSHKKTVSDELILKKTMHKTAGYTFVKPMLIGLILADKYNKENKNLCEEIGKNLGLAFQIQDDMLDIISDFKGSKIPLKDVLEGTHTVFINYVLKNGSEKEKEILRNSFGKKTFNKRVVRNMFYDSGAIEYGEKLVKDYLNKSKKLAENNKYFLDLIYLMENRKK